MSNRQNTGRPWAAWPNMMALVAGIVPTAIALALFGLMVSAVVRLFGG